MPELVHLVSPAEGVVQILFDTGPQNFSTFAANVAFLDALTRAREGGARVVVVGSAVPGAFVSHGWLPDVIDTFTGGTPSGDPLAGWRGFRELDSGPMISIAAVDGPAWGHGTELAWACDLRVASVAATFGQPEVNVGVIPGSGGTVRIARLVGESTAMHLVLDGRPIDARRAFEVGLVHRLVTAGEALSAAVEWASWLASRPAGALEAAKRAIKKSRHLPFEEALRYEGSIFAECLSKPDVVDRLRQAQRRYDAGADTHHAFGIARE
jgi:enoyl-CoA hydratase/carnithine racemase